MPPGEANIGVANISKMEYRPIPNLSVMNPLTVQFHVLGLSLDNAG